jgi:hypothetical protein
MSMKIKWYFNSHSCDREFCMGYFTVLPQARLHSVEWYDGRWIITGNNLEGRKKITETWARIPGMPSIFLNRSPESHGFASTVCVNCEYLRSLRSWPWILWDMTPCSLVDVYGNFTVASCRHMLPLLLWTWKRHFLRNVSMHLPLSKTSHTRRQYCSSWECNEISTNTFPWSESTRYTRVHTSTLCSPFCRIICISMCFYIITVNDKLNSVVWVRERTIPTERPPLVGEVSASFCG